MTSVAILTDAIGRNVVGGLLRGQPVMSQLEMTKVDIIRYNYNGLVV